MKILVVWDWEPFLPQVVGWDDGLAAALNELKNRGHELLFITSGSLDTVITHHYFNIVVSSNIYLAAKLAKPDVILHWADFTRPNAEPLKKLKIPMAICFAGGDTEGPTRGCFDHIFVESDIYWAKLRADGLSVSIAFGTNTDLFSPVKQPKVFDTIFPANFSSWKRHSLYAEATEGLKSLAVGHMRPGIEENTWKSCQENNVMILPHASSVMMKWLMAASKICVVTSESAGGSQRTVLEAMAMNMPVIVTDSDKFDWAAERIYRCEPDAKEIRAYVKTLLDGEPDISTRDYVVDNWSHKTYADSLEEGLKEIAH